MEIVMPDRLENEELKKRMKKPKKSATERKTKQEKTRTSEEKSNKQTRVGVGAEETAEALRRLLSAVQKGNSVKAK